MQDSATVLTAWSNFYVITGSSAAALTGLMFVVITLVVGRRTEGSSVGVSTYSTPTVVYFGMGLLISAIIAAPWRSLVHAGVASAIAGIFLALYIARVALQTTRQSTYHPGVDDWIWYWIAPMIASLAIVCGGILLARGSVEAMFLMAAATLMLIFIGIRNAWDIVTYVAIYLPEAERKDEAPSQDNPIR